MRLLKYNKTDRIKHEKPGEFQGEQCSNTSLRNAQAFLRKQGSLMLGMPHVASSQIGPCYPQAGRSSTREPRQSLATSSRKNGSTALLQGAGLQLPGRLPQGGSIHSIYNHLPAVKVKPFFQSYAVQDIDRQAQRPLYEKDANPQVGSRSTVPSHLNESASKRSILCSGTYPHQHNGVENLLGQLNQLSITT